MPRPPRKPLALVIGIIVILAGGAYPITRLILSPSTDRDVTARRPPHPCCSTLRLAVGSENAPLLQDPNVQEAFRDNGLSVQVTGFGSRQLAHIHFSEYDALIASSQITANQIQSNASQLRGQAQIQLFQSPLAIATYQPIASCLRSLRIAWQDSRGIWEFSVAAYLKAVNAGLKWSQCSGVAPLTNNILVTTTNPQCSNSGEMFVADASYVANHDQTVTRRAVPAVVSDLTAMIANQGFMTNTTENVFKDYLNNGMTYTPMALIYEAQFLREEITKPSAMSADMILMYPTPNVYSIRVLIPVQGHLGGGKFGDLILDNPELQRLAQAPYGFRFSNPSEFQDVVGRHRVFGHNIIVPTQFQRGVVPDQPILEDIINAIDPLAPNPLTGC